jgi:hypothetical protein
LYKFTRQALVGVHTIVFDEPCSFEEEKQATAVTNVVTMISGRANLWQKQIACSHTCDDSDMQP